MFFRGSRYAKVETARISIEGRGEIAYKKVRVITIPARQKDHLVSDAERLDLIAHRHLNDAERFWRICDANRALWPSDLVSRAGRRIAIPTSEE